MNKSGEKKIQRTLYRTTWEKNPMLKDWIQSVPGRPDKAFCRFCQRLLYAHRYSVLKHTCTTKHQQNAGKFRAVVEPQTVAETGACEDSDGVDAPDEILSSEDATSAVIDIDAEYHQEEDPNSGTETEGSKQFVSFFISNDGEDQEELPEETMSDKVEEADYVEELNFVDHDEEYHFGSPNQTETENQSTSNMSQKRLTLSTHILDTSRGRAAANVSVTLFKLRNNMWKEIHREATNADGRVSNMNGSGEDLTLGLYKLNFDTGSYFTRTTTKFLYPFVEIVFNCDELGHYHIPLLLNPFGYSTYRGT